MASVHPLKPPSLLHVRVELEWVEPRVWRRLALPDTLTLERLHRVLQVAMGWTDSHLHDFTIGSHRYGIPDPEWDFDGSLIAEKRIVLVQALGRRKTFAYTYDFGDGWEHKLTLEKRHPATTPQRYAVCIAGENACPPEDVGGPPGYADYLEALGDPNHPEHAAMLEWRGDDFDPFHFDLAATNKLLKRIRL